MKNHISEMSSRYLGIQVDFESNVTWSCRFGCPLDTNDARSRGEKGNSWLETKKKKKSRVGGRKLKADLHQEPLQLLCRKMKIGILRDHEQF